jgi:hypothetical protein
MSKDTSPKRALPYIPRATPVIQQALAFDTPAVLNLIASVVEVWPDDTKFTTIKPEPFVDNKGEPIIDRKTGKQRMILPLWRLASPEFRRRVVDLENAIHIIPAVWEKTGEPIPRNRREVETLLGLIGRSDIVTAGNWTPAGIAPMLIGELQRRRESLAASDALTELLTKQQLSKYFCCGRNHVDRLVLSVYPHEKIGEKCRMHVNNMPIGYRVKHGLK